MVEKIDTKTVCHFCKNYSYDRIKRYSCCGEAPTTSNDYGTFITGCSCKFDPNLKDLFESTEKNIEDTLIEKISKLELKNSILESEKSRLKDSILKLSEQK
jgi:hypothetical protein